MAPPHDRRRRRFRRQRPSPDRIARVLRDGLEDPHQHSLTSADGALAELCHPGVRIVTVLTGSGLSIGESATHLGHRGRVPWPRPGDLGFPEDGEETDMQIDVYEHNVPSWVDVSSSDFDVSQKFYSE